MRNQTFRLKIFKQMPTIFLHKKNKKQFNNCFFIKKLYFLSITFYIMTDIWMKIAWNYRRVICYRKTLPIKY